MSGDQFNWFEGEEVEIPLGGEGFKPTGFIGRIEAAMLYTFWSEADLNDEVFKAPKYFYRHQAKTGKYEYYYKDPATAAAAVKAGSINFTPQQQWVFQIETRKVMNSADVEKLAAGWGEIITVKSAVTTYRSKNRHQFHLITLPVTVYALAKVRGYEVPEPPESFYHLMDQDLEVNDEYKDLMVGSNDERDMKVIMANSIMGMYRTALWAALGETNPLNYTIGKKKGDGSSFEFNTEAEKLVKCLQVYHKAWTQPFYARLLLVTEPVVSEFKGLLPAISEVFLSEKDAIKAGKEDIERIEAAQEKKAQAGGGEVKANGKPKLPEVWAESGANAEQGWVESLTGVVKANPQGKMPQAVWLSKIKGDVEAIGGTVEDVKEWLPFLSL